MILFLTDKQFSNQRLTHMISPFVHLCVVMEGTQLARIRDHGLLLDFFIQT